ncbi:hypothetical protein CC1G_02709 [Coprinopsis cinerea okayama7|uniref:BTB domain-containing protein n=1 Tax=Coprinopsis cinerea (strain Okayama-7 / 130 / ATCC MYA-4618 / FGSC 9003) TaxID=240176 RepID=A8PBQ8_COPC7|nr:hypothetical protein CC1G_02709 [Coprinopsis cinerea okayama7\|eukprot:XP_001840246.2 hypothetical protein CC1G_02709 [Coprinopsis cinerea okayama7\
MRKPRVRFVPCLCDSRITSLTGFFQNLQDFVLDCRSHPSERLCKAEFADLQGPALLAFNNATFQPDDWVAVKSISRSSKKADTSKIGKFGIGIRSCYHSLSSDGLVLQLDGDVTETIDHFRPFGHFMGEDWRGGAFDGTVIRLPFRRYVGEIQDRVVTPQEIEDLMLDFINDEFNISMLFLQHLRSIALYKIDDSGTITELGSCNITPKPIADKVFKKTVAITKSGMDVEEEWLVILSEFSEKEAFEALLSRVKTELDPRILQKHKLRPDVGIAYPLHKTTNSIGYLFTYLRLPLATGFPAHVHAFFALTPSRQNLRNPGDNGIVKGSNDHLLVEWNKVLFEVFIPRAWTRFLQALIANEPKHDVFKAWPASQELSRCGESVYWNNFPQAVLHSIIDADAAVWPVFGGAHVHKRLRDIIIASSDVPSKVTQAFSNLGLSITLPPQDVVKLLRSRDRSPSHTPYAKAARILSPESAAAELRKSCLDILRQPEVTATIDLNVITDYLLSTNNLGNIVDIPIIPTVKNERIALHASRNTKGHHTLLEKEDIDLFGGCDAHAIALNVFSDRVADLLRREGPKKLDVKRLDADIVVTYLNRLPKERGIEFSAVKIDRPAVHLLTAFWMWLGGSRLKKDLIPKLQPMYLLPCANGVRQASATVFEVGNTPERLVALLQRLGVPFLHPDFLEKARKVVRGLGTVKSVDDIPALLNCLADHQGQFPVGMADSDAAMLLKHFSDNINRHTVLSASQTTTLKKLPIFPSVSAAPDSARRITQWVPVNDSKIYGVSSKAILPSIPGIAYLTTTHVQSDMLRLLEAASLKSLSEVEVLQLALKEQALPLQSPVILEDLMKYLVEIEEKLPESLRKPLKREKFVLAANGRFAAPENLIDPSNPLRPLYSQDRSRIPATSTPTQKGIVEAASALKLLDYQLSPVNVKDRIEWISSNSRDRAFFQHSIDLLKILDRANFDYSTLGDTNDARQNWLPTVCNKLVSPSECRPAPGQSDELALFDRVLKRLHPKAAISTSFARAAGWDKPVPTPVILQQIGLVLKETPDPHYRVMVILKELGRRSLRQSEIEQLKRTLEGTRWVPTMGYRLVQPNCAVFQQAIPEAEIEEVHPILTREQGPYSLLKQLGCTDRPSFDSVLALLKNMSIRPPSDDTTRIAMSLLKFVTRNSPSEEQLSQLLIPDDRDTLRPRSEVIFNDIPHMVDLVPSDDYHMASPSIDEPLAQALKLERLGLKFGDLQQSTEDMGASPVTLVQETIKQYTERQFLSEFLANAEDAQATTFSVVLSEDLAAMTTGRPRLLSSDMEKFYKCPYVFVYNDSFFSEKDFQGILRIHVGGKREDSHSIGQFGLGALTMFHFSELVVILSGDQALFLDPSKRHLPMGRASWRIPLKQLAQRYPDSLLPLKGLPWEIQDSRRFPGTLFMLPLRAGSHCSEQGISSKVWEASAFKQLLQEFRSTAAQSLLFIKLRRIEAFSCLYSGKASPLWIVSASRTDTARDDSNFIVTNTSIEEEGIGGQLTPARWLVVSATISPDNIPENLSTNLKRVKHVRVGLAAPFSRRAQQCRFFSTLPLAITTELPVHVNASFALSSDRRGIRHDTYNSAETAFNQWLLSEPLVQVYLAMLEEIARTQDNAQWWPAAFKLDRIEPPVGASQGADLTKSLVESFYRVHLPSTERQVCWPFFKNSNNFASMTPGNALLFPPFLPRPVLTFLSRSQPANVTELRIPQSYQDEAKLKSITPEHVKDWVLALPAAAQTSYKDEEFQELLSHLASSDVTNLIGLPLLRLQSKQWTVFRQRDNMPPKYLWRPGPVAAINLFPPSSFVDHDTLDRLLEQKILDGGLNIAPFDATGLKALTQTELTSLRTNELPSWINKFWTAYPSFETQGIRESIEDLPLVPSTAGEYISLSDCKSGGALIAADGELADDDVMRLIQEFEITVVAKERCPPALANILNMEEYLKSSEGNFITRLLRSLKSDIQAVKQRIDSWPDHERETLSHWFTSQVQSRIPDEVIRTARELPIWRGHKQHQVAWKSASGVRLLPIGVDFEAQAFLNVFVVRGLPPTYFNVHRLTINELETALRFPPRLEAPDEPGYRSILNFLLDGIHNTYDELEIPDGTRAFVPARSLYTRENLFRQAFGDRPERFLLESLRNPFEQLLRAKRLIIREEDLNMDIFVTCARALDEDVLDNNLNPQEVVERARVVFRAYCEQLPLRISSQAVQQWRRVENLRFIPRNMATSRQYAGGTLEIPERVRNLPMVVPPNDLKAIFAEQPDNRVVLANPKLGEPPVSVVIDHLRELKTMRQGPDVLRYLKSTYAWLDKNLADAREVVAALKDEALFLNVNDPAVDAWEWISPSRMAFENHDVANIQRVRGFLLSYKDLLKEAGVADVNYPDFDPSGALGGKEHELLLRSRASYARQREKKQLTDVILRSKEEDHLEDGERNKFYAHRSFLASYGGYFESMFTGEFAEGQEASPSNPVEVPLDYSVFAIKTVLDFLYDGDSAIRDESAKWEDLLQVMELANYLDLSNLFENVQVVIIRRKLVDPLNLDYVKAFAERVGANRLKEWCVQYEAKNKDYVDRIKASIEQQGG